MFNNALKIISLAIALILFSNGGHAKAEQKMNGDQVDQIIAELSQARSQALSMAMRADLAIQKLTTARENNDLTDETINKTYDDFLNDALGIQPETAGEK